MVNCPRCRRSFRTTRGLQVHQRWKMRCIPFIEEAIVASRQGTPAPGPMNSRDLPRFMQRFTPELEELRDNWLYFTAIHEDTPLQPLDESDHIIRRYQVPDENDERHQRVADYVEGVIEANHLARVLDEPHIVEEKKSVFRWLFILFSLLFNGMGMVGAVSVIWYMLFCHEGQCPITVDHYRSGLGRFIKMVLN